MHPIFATDREGNIKMKPVGYVKSPIIETQTGGLAEIETKVIINDDRGRWLEGIHAFSHILVV